jgi:transposase
VDSHLKEETMARPKEIIDQDLVEQAQKQLKRFKDGKVYMRLLAIVRAGDHPIVEVAAFFGVTRGTISRWIRSFCKDGVEGLFDRAKGHNPSKLSNEQKQIINRWIETASDAGGEPVHWTLEKLQQHVKRHFGVQISIFPLWLHLHKMGFRQKIPRPVHHKADPKVQQAFKKNC